DTLHSIGFSDFCVHDTFNHSHPADGGQCYLRTSFPKFTEVYPETLLGVCREIISCCSEWNVEEERVANNEHGGTQQSVLGAYWDGFHGAHTGYSLVRDAKQVNSRMTKVADIKAVCRELCPPLVWKSLSAGKRRLKAVINSLR